MNFVYICDEDKKIVIDIYDNNLIGYSFYNDGRIVSIDEKELNIFQAFLLSKNYTILPNEDKYQVILDKDTGFKHYYLNGKEDYKMFYLNNGEDTIQYLENKNLYNNEKNSFREKVFNIGKKIVRCTQLGFLTIMLALSISNAILIVKEPTRVKDFRTIPIVEWVIGKKDYTAKDLISMISSSTNLTNEIKSFLSNEDFLNDILPYVNSSNFMKFLYGYRFDNIKVETFDNTNNRYRKGYYIPSTSNTIYVAKSVVTGYKGIISHEFIHLCQGLCSYNVIVEACAEILSNEYFDDSPYDAYPEEVFLIKKMMEIIGSEPILEYIFTDNFNSISDAIKPYLSDEEYSVFLSDLKMTYIDSEDYNQSESNEKHASLDNLLDIIYQRKFGININEDPVIPYLKGNSLIKYYFNKKKMEKDGSYLKINTRRKVTLSLKEAMEKDLICLFQFADDNTQERISYDDYLNIRYNVNKPLYYKAENDVALIQDNENKIISVNIIIEENGTYTLPTLNNKIK